MNAALYALTAVHAFRTLRRRQRDRYRIRPFTAKSAFPTVSRLLGLSTRGRVRSLSTMPLAGLQSQDRRDLLDIVDNLRSLGVNRYVDLPQIVVCGDQSAGKSSSLKAISGLSFATKENLCNFLVFGVVRCLLLHGILHERLHDKQKRVEARFVPFAPCLASARGIPYGA